MGEKKVNTEDRWGYELQCKKCLIITDWHTLIKAEKDWWSFFNFVKIKAMETRYEKCGNCQMITKQELIAFDLPDDPTIEFINE